MLPANLEREIQAAVAIRDLQSRVRRLETLEEPSGTGCLFLIEDVAPTIDTTSVEFTSIPQTYKHLWLLLAVTDNDTNIQMFMSFNGLANKHDWELMSGTTISSDTNDSRIVLGGTGGGGWVAHEINILDYVRPASGTRVLWKGASTGGAPGDTIFQGGAILTTQVAVTSIKIETSTGGFLANQTRFTLYGLC